MWAVCVPLEAKKFTSGKKCQNNAQNRYKIALWTVDFRVFKFLKTNIGQKSTLPGNFSLKLCIIFLALSQFFKGWEKKSLLKNLRGGEPGYDELEKIGHSYLYTEWIFIERIFVYAARADALQFGGPGEWKQREVGQVKHREDAVAEDQEAVQGGAGADKGHGRALK